MSSPLVSVIIVNWNGGEMLLACLRSLQTFCTYPHEVIVVDNASTDNSVRSIQTHFPQVQLIANHHNRGFAAANNQGLARATGECIVFLNPDTELIQEPFLPLLESLQKNPAIGCIAPQLLNADRTPQLSVRPFPKFWDQVFILLKLRPFLSWTPLMKKYLGQTISASSDRLSVDQVMGAAMVLPRRVIDIVGGWDEQFWIWFEEVDLCYRLKQHGWQVMYQPATKIIHHGGSSFQQVFSWRKQWWLLQSLRRYITKHWAWWPRLGLTALMPISYGLIFIQSTFKPK